MSTRNSVIDGLFYPEKEEELGSTVLNYLKKVENIPYIKDLKAIIVPHASYKYSGQVAAYAYALLSRFKNKIKKVIIIGPSHTEDINNIFTDDNKFWETPLGKVKVMENDFDEKESAHIKEHSIEVQIPFLQVVLDDFEILPLVTGIVDPKKISEKIIHLIDDKTLLIISSDLSHYHEYDSCIRLDNITNHAVEKLDFNMMAECEACGNIPILSLIQIAKKLNWKAKLLKYKNTGDTTGEKGSVVGYSSFAFYKE